MTHRYVHILFSSAKPCAVSQVSQALHQVDFLLPSFWGKPLFPAELSAVIRADTLASASLRDPCRTHTSCPPKTTGQPWDSLQQLHFQKGPFLLAQLSAPKPVQREAFFMKYCHCFCIVHVWACLMWACMPQMNTAGHWKCHLQINLAHSRLLEK